jgi:excisionase family DNA binding protein
MNQNTNTLPSPWLTTEQAANYLGVGVRTLEDIRAAGRGPPTKRIGTRLVRYNRDDLDAWMQSAGAPL